MAADGQKRRGRSAAFCRRWGGGLCTALGMLAACASPAPLPEGLEVVALRPGSPAAGAGVAVGDRLIAVRAASSPSPQPLANCLDLASAELELGPRGSLRLLLSRQGEARELDLPTSGDWGLEVASGVGDTPAARACRALGAVSAAWNAQRFDEADRLYEGAITAAAPLGSPLHEAYLRHRQGKLRLALDRFDAAREALTRGLELRRAVAPESLAAAASWQALGELESRQGRLVESDRAFGAAVALRAKLAPESLEHAWSLASLGVNAYWRLDFAAAIDFYSQASERMRRVAPGSADLAAMEVNLGLLERERGDLSSAAAHLDTARGLYAALDPNGERLATAVLNRALVAMDQGDLAASEDLHQEALRRYERLAPRSLAVAQIYENLGVIARDREDLAAAESLLRRSLALRESLGASPRELARSLSPLAWVVARQGRPEEARPLASRVLALSAERQGVEGNADETPQASASLLTLAEITAEAGDLPAAVALAERAMVWKRKVNPGSLQVAIGLEVLGDLLSRAGRFQAAEEAFAESITLFERLAPDSYRLANVWGARGRHLERAGRPAAAADAYQASIAALEAQIGRLGGGQDARASFLREHGGPYQRLMVLELERGEAAAALAVLERSRGRDLLAQLLARRLGGGAEVPPELARELHATDLAYDRAQGQLAATEERSLPEVRARLLSELAVQASRRAVLRDRLAQASPRYGRLLEPAAPDLTAIRRGLEAGTLWLAYSVLEAETVLFIVRGEADEPNPERSLRVVRLPVGGSELARRVAMFRSVVLAGREQPGELEALRFLGFELYHLLVAPAEPELSRVSRVMVSADGPLHLLPFAALVTAAPGGHFWAEEKSVFLAASGTIAAELSSPTSEPAAGPPPGFAFVAPAVPRAEAGAVATGSVLERFRAGLTPLPGARAEAQALSSLWGDGVRVLAGRQANESAVKDLPVRAAFVHFACHALLDASSPLDSALALSAPAPGAPEEDNGLLQAWEIFDQLRLDTPLVALSACETGLGRDGGGEGLVGLARAFQYAGARSVLATLWQVGDRASAELVARFYRGWVAGLPRDVALAEAQRAMIRSAGATAHPFYWAGFTLSGSPRP